MSHHSRARRFVPAFDSLAFRVLPSTMTVAPPCPMDPVVMTPPATISFPTTTPGDPMAASLCLNTPIYDPSH